MKFIEVILAYAGCLALCYLIAKVYFMGALRIHNKFQRGSTRPLLLYAWLILFLVSVITIGIFGPAWISEKRELLARSSELTVVLIVIGAIGWASRVSSSLS